MGVGYDGVGGIGIEVTSDMVNLFQYYGLFTEDEWNDDSYSCLEKTGFIFSGAGDGAYSGDDDRYYFFVDGGTLVEINKNAPLFISKLAEYGIHIDLSDLVVIEDLHVW